MFRGRFEHTIDFKGRVSIPAKFRELLSEKYDDHIIMTNFDRCLVAFPYEEWRNVEDKISSLSMVKKEVKAFQRFFISGATECSIDKLGRVLIPPTLRDYALLEKNVIFAGMGKMFEIWSRERWTEEIKRAEENFEGMREALASLGI
ncbi:MAG TPA: division/cell wall cluster transcriptional repressor MraZ [Thermodesulfobacteriota bacterium]|nr:division/cell wall cluster transcriptional repressor MraZ [Thermodesulfobacteriota bacterium]